MMDATRPCADALNGEVRAIGRGEVEICVRGSGLPQWTRVKPTHPDLEGGGYIVWLAPEQEGVVRHRLLEEQVKGAIEAVLDRRLSERPRKDHGDDGDACLAGGTVGEARPCWRSCRTAGCR